MSLNFFIHPGHNVQYLVELVQKQVDFSEFSWKSFTTQLSIFCSSIIYPSIHYYASPPFFFFFFLHKLYYLKVSEELPLGWTLTISINVYGFLISYCLKNFLPFSILYISFDEYVCIWEPPSLLNN